MIQVSLDTSYLISFADPARPNHAVAVEYFRHCLAQLRLPPAPS
jgi:predicted nucleic acid-binding protein